MEIIFRSEAAISKWIKLPGILWCLVVLIHSCSRKDILPSEIKSKTSLQQFIDNGDLLNSFTKDKTVYTFAFETGNLQVPENEIKQINSIPEQWKTIIAFTDNTQLVVPTKGTSLNFIVENIQLNPSGVNPLAAIANVSLPTYGRVKVTVLGKNGAAGNITHLCHAQTAKQAVPILGLYPNYNNDVQLTFTDKNGKERGSANIKIQTTSLPANFPDLSLVKSDPQKMEPGVNLVSYPGESELDISIPYMVDNEGAVRWVLLFKSSADLNPFSASIGLHRTKKGTFISGDQAKPRIVEIDMFGNLLKQWDLQKLGYTFHHEVTEAQNGNFLVTVTKPSARLTDGKPRVNDHIIELDPFNNSVVKEWDFANLVDTSRYLKPDGFTPPEFSQNPTNWVHNNSIAELENNLLATMRYQGILSFTHAGNLRWLISPHKYWSQKFQSYLLNPIDENGNPVTDPAVINGDAAAPGFDWPWGPHTPVVLPDNNILVFDNGYNRNWVSLALKDNNYSRVVEYKVDETKKTVQQVWSFGHTLGANGFSQALSGVQYLPITKHILFCPGMGVKTSKGLGGRIIELDPITKEIIFNLEITVSSISAFHRATRMSLYPDTI